MNGQVLRTAWYRFRATFGHRRGGYFTLVLLVGLVGGLAMGALSAARRTQSSFSTYLASTNPSDLSVSIFGGFGNGGGSVNASSSVTEQIAHLPGVKHVESAIFILAIPVRRPPGVQQHILNEVLPLASVDGLYFDQDHLAVVQGRMANPYRPDQIVMTALAARTFGAHVGQVVPFGLYTQKQTTLPGFGTPRVPPHRLINAKLVGLVQLDNAVVQDDIDRFPTFVFFTPALGQEVVADSGQGAGGTIFYGLQLDEGDSGVAAAEREFSALVPPGTVYAFHATAPINAKVDLTVKPMAIALGVFGAVAALAALLIGLQVVSRQLRDADEELTVLRALGAGPTTAAADGLIGILAAVVAGSLLAAVVAVGLSPLSPLGPVRPVYPGPAIAFDWTVLGLGVLVLIGGLGAIALVLAYRGAPHRAARRARLAPRSTSKAVGVIASMGLPAPAVVGVRFALETGRGRSAVPVRSASLGASLAVALVVATFTFGSGLHSLVSNPALYGWDWSYMLNASNVVPPQALSLLDQDRHVVAWTGYDDLDAEIDGQDVPFLIEDGQPADKGQAVPPVLAGHTVDAKEQIVLGAASLAQLHKHVGDTVVVTYGIPRDAPVYVPPTRLVIVGTATMPAIGESSVLSDHTSMGTGALASYAMFPTAFQQAGNSPDPTLNGPGLVLVRLSHDTPVAAGLADMQRVADAANNAFATVPNGGGIGDTVSVMGVQRPAEIVNYRTMDATPALLAASLAAGAVVALGLTLAASVRRRRHDLALLKTLGFTQRQLASAVAWQASVAAVIGTVIGVPAGIAVGRWLWTLFAREIYAVPQPTVPVLPVLLVALGGIVIANVVAAIPGRSAARTSTALLLQAE